MNRPNPDVSSASLLQQREKIRRALARVNVVAAIILTALVALLALAVAAASRAEVSAHRALQATQRGEEELWKSYLAQARAERLTGLPGRREQSIGAIAAAVKIRASIELRNEAIAALALTDVQFDGALVPLPREMFSHGFDSQIRWIACHDNRGKTVVRNFSEEKGEVTLKGPEQPVRARAFSPDSKLLAVAYAKGDIIVWDIAKQARHFSAKFDDRHDRGLGLAFTSDGRELVIGDLGAQVIRFLDSADGREVRKIDERFPERIQLHSKLPLVASITEGGSDISIRNWETGAVVHIYTNASPIMNFAWAPEPGLMAAGDGAGSITIWDQSTGEKSNIPAHEGLINRLAFSPDGTLLASGSWDGFSRLWDPMSGRRVLNLEGGFAEAFSADGERLAFEREGAGVGFWNLRRSSIFRAIHANAGPRKTVFSASFSRDGKFVAATGGDGVRILNAHNGREVALLPIPGGNQWGIGAEFSSDGKNLVASSAKGFYIWPLESLENVRAGAPKLIPVNAGELGGFRLSADARLAVGQAGSQHALVLDLHEPEKSLVIAHSGVNSVAISRDQKWIATGTAHGEGHRIWDRSGKLVAELDQENGMVDFSPDGRALVTSSTKEFVLWETGSWKKIHTISRSAANERSAHSAFSPDGSLLALVHSLGVIQLVNPQDGTILAMLRTPDPTAANHISFSADGGKLAIASAPNLVQLWDVQSMRQELANLGLDWASPEKTNHSTPLIASAPFAWTGHRQLAIFTLVVGAFAFALACVVFQRHRQLIRAYAHVERIVEQRGSELELARSEIMHSQKMKALGTLAAGIAHDFNNLLSVIRMSNDLNEEARTADEIKANSVEIDSAVQQGKGVVRSMLGYCKTNGDVGPFSVADAVQASMGLLSKQFLSGVIMKLDFETAAPLVNADRGRIEQIILNLVVNASEAMKGEGRLEVAVRAVNGSSAWNILRPSHALEYVELVVRDSGPGIEPALVPRLFEPFFTTKLTGAARGTGLGLSIVYTIASKDGLGIAVDSTPGHGAEFRIAIPAVRLESTVAKAREVT